MYNRSLSRELSLLSLGLVIVSNGINVAHELCHRTNTPERILGKFLLIPSLYMHFYLEHNYGHHLKVATKEDPVTAKYNEPSELLENEIFSSFCLSLELLILSER